MTRWLAILLPLSMLGQTPYSGTGTEPVAPVPETGELDPATREQRDVVEAARDEADTFETPGVTPMYPPTPATPDTSASAQGAPPVTPGLEGGFGGSGAGTPDAGTGGTAAAPTSEAQQPTPEQMARQIQELRSQVQSLEEQLAQSEEQLAQNEETTAGLQQNMSTLQSNAEALERLRQQRIGYIQRAWGWLLAADNALAVGELAVDEALRQADLSLGDALENASVTGKGETVQLMQSARQLVGFARASVANRDVYNARLRLQSAGENLRQAQALSMARPDVSLATPLATETPAPAGSAEGQ